jgi:hypothetical protein
MRGITSSGTNRPSRSREPRPSENAQSRSKTMSSRGKSRMTATGRSTVPSPGRTDEGSPRRNDRSARWSRASVRGVVFTVIRTTISASSFRDRRHPMRVISTLTSRATMTVLNANEMMLLPVTTRRIRLVVMSTSELENVVPI